MIYHRTPRGYSGVNRTSHKLGDILPKVLEGLCKTQNSGAELVIAAWPDVIGHPLAGMTEAISMQEGVLTVKVHNPTLYSLLCGQDKWRILGILQRRFPSAHIKNIIFTMRGNFATPS